MSTQRSAHPAGAVLAAAADAAIAYLEGASDRSVAAPLTRENIDAIRGILDTGLPEDGHAAQDILDDIVAVSPLGVVVNQGTNYSYVTGGATPAAHAADLWTGVVDQFGARYDSAPAMATAEDVALGWLCDLLGLRSGPGGRTIVGGFVSGTTRAHATCMAAATHHLLALRGWDVAARGLRGSPPFSVIVSADVHVSVLAVLQQLGLGRDSVLRIPTDGHGRMLVDQVHHTLVRCNGPALVVAAAGEINTGSFDALYDIAALTRAGGHWLHIDGAFGAWAAASPRLRHLTIGMELADSWAFDLHKWVVPYAGGVAFTAHPAAHRAAMGSDAAYTQVGVPPLSAAQYNPMDYVPDMARRPHLPAYAALRELGRRGVADLVERCHDHAVLLARLLQQDLRIRVSNPIWFNQVLIDVTPPTLSLAAAEQHVSAVIEHIRASGKFVVGGTRWRHRPMLRVSINHPYTTADHMHRLATAISVAVDNTPTTALVLEELTVGGRQS